ncbi:MAG TPA: D-2-hydroxyacid dehydrogenase [Lacunisphaera sp.]|nr:D-2-hydroxyacid dehydrogenase [Lacunisphaera sp.]
MKIFASGIHDADAQAALRRVTAGDEVTFASPGGRAAADRQAVAEAEVALGACPPELLASAVRLRWIQFLAVGIDAYRDGPWPELGGRVTCTNLGGVFAEPMAQSVLAGLLALERGLDQALRLQARQSWQKDRLHAGARVLRGAHVLLLGGGAVGNRVRQLLAAFGCTFTTFARTSGDIHTAAELDAALPRADIVCAALPDTPATRDLLDARRLALLKRDALLVNVGRGSLLDEAALARALHAGALRGALLDVTRHEPLAPDDPLWRCPRLILTQHSAAGSGDELTAAVDFFGENLARYRRGRALLNVIDWRKGY